MERKVLQLVLNEHKCQSGSEAFEPLSRDDILQARVSVNQVYLAPELESYIVQLVDASRHSERYDKDLSQWIAYGASTRGTIGLALAAKAHAWLNGRDYVSPEDIHQIAPDVLRHRILLGFDAEADGVQIEEVITRLLSLVPVP